MSDTVAGYPKVIWPLEPMNKGCDDDGNDDGSKIVYDPDCSGLFANVEVKPFDVIPTVVPMTLAADNDPDRIALIKFNVVGKPVDVVPSAFTKRGCLLFGRLGGKDSWYADVCATSRDSCTDTLGLN